LARQFLAAGLVDELQLHVVPVLLGDGIPLLGGITVDRPMRKIRVVDSPIVTHVRYRFDPR
jgi:dihydrofolate reductase